VRFEVLSELMCACSYVYLYVSEHGDGDVYAVVFILNLFILHVVMPIDL
jgi:hypothetical protein